MSPFELAEYVQERVRQTPGHGPWSYLDYRLVGVIDRLDSVVRAVIAAAGNTPPHIEPYPRPGMARRDEASDTAREFMARRRAQIRAQLEQARKQEQEPPEGA